jgi:nitrite reductase/ring-hydroxylating ferredoxin subunit
VGLGVGAAVPTAAAGWADYADTTKVDERVRRIGIVHAVANVAALGLFGASWLARRRGDHGRGVALGLAGAGALGAGGHLGGHLSYAKGVGVDRTAFERRPAEWTFALAESDLAEGEPRAAEVAGAQVLLVRRGDRIFALAARCSHRGGPLHEGELTGDCIQCPWHGTRFRLEDGAVERGPGTFPQPAYEVRLREGQVEVRSAEH